jgi:hypothetical protein
VSVKVKEDVVGVDAEDILRSFLTSVPTLFLLLCTLVDIPTDLR